MALNLTGGEDGTLPASPAVETPATPLPGVAMDDVQAHREAALSERERRMDALEARLVAILDVTSVGGTAAAVAGLPAGPPVHVAGGIIPLAPGEEVGQAPAGRLPVTIHLEEFLANWLTARAAAHGQGPAEHAESILRLYWAGIDRWRHEQAGAPIGRNPISGAG